MTLYRYLILKVLNENKKDFEHAYACIRMLVLTLNKQYKA